MSFLIGYLVFAWTEPPTFPPGGNVPAPINVSGATQTKSGALTIGGGVTAPSFVDTVYDVNPGEYLIDPQGQAVTGYSAILKGKVGIGTTSPGAKLDISNTTEAKGLQATTNYSAATTYGITGGASGGTSQNLGGKFSASGGAGSFGVYASATGASNNYGVQGYVYGDTVTTKYYALYGYAVSAGTNFALYGYADKGGTNWGLYVEKGNAYLGGNVGIGTTSPGSKFTVRRSTAGTAFGVRNTADIADTFTITDAGDLTLIKSVTYSWPSAQGAAGTNTCLTNNGSGTLSWGTCGGTGGVSSVSNSDGTLTISPTTGAVVASLNLAHANTWTGAQTFSVNTNFPGSGIWNTSGNVGIGTTGPNNKLTVNGGLNVLGAISSGTGLTLSDEVGYKRIQSYESEPLAINPVGNNVGIGTTTPQNKLDVEGGIAVGATYSGTNTAPSNGMIIEGNVGIGTADPGTYKLKVDGDGNITGNLTVGGISDAEFVKTDSSGKLVKGDFTTGVYYSGVGSYEDETAEDDCSGSVGTVCEIVTLKPTSNCFCALSGVTHYEESYALNRTADCMIGVSGSNYILLAMLANWGAADWKVDCFAWCLCW